MSVDGGSTGFVVVGACVVTGAGVVVAIGAVVPGVTSPSTVIFVLLSSRPPK